jgi:hypothetical protein
MKIRVLAAVVLFSLNVVAAESALTPSTKIPLLGVKGRFDHFAVDVERQRLFVAALGNNTLEVIDIREGKHLQSISGMSKPTGVCFLPKKNWIGVANGEKGTFELVDGSNYRVLQTIRGLDDADNVRFDAKRNLVYVGFGDGSLAIVDPEKAVKDGEIKLKGHPESFQLETNGPRIFVNVPDKKEVAVIDRDQRRVISEWPMADYAANFPMALDEENQRLFIGCRNPPQVVILDTSNGKRVGQFKIAGDTDDLFHDGRRKMVLVSCGEGKIEIFRQRAPDMFENVQSLQTSAGARTSFYSAELGLFALAVPGRANIEPAIWIYKLSE